MAKVSEANERLRASGSSSVTLAPFAGVQLALASVDTVAHALIGQVGVKSTWFVRGRSAYRPNTGSDRCFRRCLD
jgi:hypothetical protein